MGRDKLEIHLKDYKARNELKQLTPKEENALKDMRIVQELYARGFDFMPINIFEVKAKRFQIIDNKIMPALIAIDGLGEIAAESIEIASRKGSYLSKDDFKQRAKIGKTVADLLDSLGILGDMPETNQLSLFDM